MLRWHLKMGDEAAATGIAFDQFVSHFIRFESAERAPEEAHHWVAELDGEIGAVMTVIRVQKVPSPDGESGHWFYLTNCYVLPKHRNRGIGEALLSEIKSWAVDGEAELMLVWPSERAFAFYERCGFVQPDGVLGWEP